MRLLRFRLDCQAFYLSLCFCRVLLVRLDSVVQSFYSKATGVDVEPARLLYKYDICSDRLEF